MIRLNKVTGKDATFLKYIVIVRKSTIYLILLLNIYLSYLVFAIKPSLEGVILIKLIFIDYIYLNLLISDTALF